MASVLVASVLAALAGRGLLRALGVGARLSGVAGLARAWSAGVFVLAVALLVAGKMGVPVGWPSLAGVAIALTALGTLGQRSEPLGPTPAAQSTEEWGGLAIAARTVLVAAVFLFVAKVLVVPLWSWDHFAMWGVKARWMVKDGALDLAFLQDPAFFGTRPDHPVALPMIWRLLVPGAMPGEAVFEITHVLFGLALVAVLRDAVSRRTGSRTWADLLAAYAALSPLFWDTEAKGLADMPLALVALLAADLVLDLPVLPARAAMAAGALLGLLAWIKQEGIPLALVLTLCGLAHLLRRAVGGERDERTRRALLLLAGTGTVAAGALVFRFVALAPGVAFLVGDWRSRAIERLPRLLDVGTAFGQELLAIDWLGFWLVFVAGFVLAATRREPWRTGGLLLSSAVAVQLALYFFVCYVAPAEPAVQIEAAVFRIAAALVPLALLGVGSDGTLIASLSISKESR